MKEWMNEWCVNEAQYHLGKKEPYIHNAIFYRIT